MRSRLRPGIALFTLVVALLSAGCGGTGEGEGPVQRVSVPPGASFSAVADTLESRGILDSTTWIRIYARLTGSADEVQAGVYEFREGAGYRKVLEDLTAGRIASDRVVVPEGYEIRRLAPTLAELVGRPADSVLAHMLDTATAAGFDIPGPTLEGYLYPATYAVPAGAPLDAILERMVREHTRRWTPERQARADSAGLTHREVVTLASIVEREARVRGEMDTIAAVFRNRLEIGYPLQADPTVQYALGEHQSRLLYSHIDRVADHPYNTYTHGGIPPGPIGAVSAEAIDAVLDPADVNYLYFVARPDGTHVFNRHLQEHNRDKARIRRQIESRSGEQDDGGGATSSAESAGDGG